MEREIGAVEYVPELVCEEAPERFEREAVAGKGDRSLVLERGIREMSYQQLLVRRKGRRYEDCGRSI